MKVRYSMIEVSGVLKYKAEYFKQNKLILVKIFNSIDEIDSYNRGVK